MPPKKRTQTSLPGGADKRSKQSSPSQQRETASVESMSGEVSVKEEFATNLEENGHTMSVSRPAIWCQACDKEADGLCADLQHSLTSLRMHRAGQAAPKLQRLQTAASSARKVVAALQDARDAVEAQLQEWRARLLRLEDAERELQAAVDEGRDLQTPQLEGLDLLLRDAAGLLGAECRLQLQADAGSAQWKADLQPAAPGRSALLLCALVLQLRQEESLVRVYPSEETMDVGTLSKQKKHSRELDDVLQDSALSKVRKLEGLDCDAQPTWCKLFLQRVAPHVEWLCMERALREHLEVVRGMPSLRYLYVHLNCWDGTAFAGLPLQLEELDVRNVPVDMLESVQRMPNLRKLTLYNFHGERVEFSFPAVPALHRGLRWLTVGLWSLPSLLSLAKAHAATLLELRVLCSTHDDGRTPLYFRDLAEGLQQCGLVALRRVVLLRGTGTARHHVEKEICHAENTCTQQQQQFRDKLLVTVYCQKCDTTCPCYPDFGDFTWTD
ncbi:uncharacterized protein LOC117642634 [Thrips palmi]|uniref:Uncharacterized protein LOC117642634 n=1 Tax=Thrips palmi TaxID=161013 RepID=A0A6P8YIQ7_THRPL|nr:uncharacterized protein LOC117642634 [Thrips palmi]